MSLVGQLSKYPGYADDPRSILEGLGDDGSDPLSWKSIDGFPVFNVWQTGVMSMRVGARLYVDDRGIRYKYNKETKVPSAKDETQAPKDEKQAPKDERLTFDVDLFVSDLFSIVGSGKDADGEEVLILGTTDRDTNRPRRVVVPLATIAEGGRDVAKLLMAHGIRVAAEQEPRNALVTLLSSVNSPRLKWVDRAGWIVDTNVFVMPDGSTIGDQGDMRVHYAGVREEDSHVRKEGSYGAWKEAIQRMVPGNSRLEMAVAAAFASPLLPLATRVGSTGLNLAGDSSEGKSAAGYLFGSVWGGRRGSKLRYGHSWNQTANALAATYSNYSGVGVFLDEMSQCKEPATLAYQISEETEKERLNADSSKRRPRKWRLLVWSSGEKTLAELIAADKKNYAGVQSGVEARFLSIPATPSDAAPRAECTGIIEKLNGYKSSAEFVEAIEQLTNEHFGYAGPEFLQYLSNRIGTEGWGALSDEITASNVLFMASLGLQADASPIVYRAANVFALVATAGRMACEAGILPLAPSGIEAGVRTCFADWLGARGTVRKSAAEVRALVSLRDHLSANGHRFVDKAAASESRGQIDGYHHEVRDWDGRSVEECFAILPSAFRDISQSAARGNLVKQLGALGFLRSGSEHGSSTIKIGGQVVRVYLVSKRILSIGDDGAPPTDGVSDQDGLISRLRERATPTADQELRREDQLVVTHIDDDPQGAGASGGYNPTVLRFPSRTDLSWDEMAENLKRHAARVKAMPGNRRGGGAK